MNVMPSLSVLLKITFISLLSIIELRAQYDIGLFYTVIPSPKFYNSENQSYTLYEHFINISGRKEVYKRTHLGMDFSYCILTGENFKNPFLVLGAYVDYALFFGKGTAVYPRIGISQGNLSFAGDHSPTKRPVTSLILGLSADFQVYKNIYLWGGLFNHSPLNKIPYKFSFSQPFIGARLMLNKVKEKEVK